VARRRARSTPVRDQAELDLSRPPAAPKRTRTEADIEKAARAAIARRAQPAGPSDKVRLTLTISLSRRQAERLSARAIREERNLRES
jgi:hypothetical protein